MKNFEMPVVVLNEMTMNESIAADCCYKQVTEGYVTTKTVLNGGDIGTVTKYPLLPAIEAYYGAGILAPMYHNTVTIRSGILDPANNNITNYTEKSLPILRQYADANNVTFYDVVENNAVVTYTHYDTWRSYSVQGGPLCNHLYAKCVFNKEDKKTNQHINSNMKHLFGGIDWAQPHTAQQYNS